MTLTESLYFGYDQQFKHSKANHITHLQKQRLILKSAVVFQNVRSDTSVLNLDDLAGEIGVVLVGRDVQQVTLEP